MSIRELFVTRLFEASLADAPDFAAFNAELEAACRTLSREDLAGRAWCKAHRYGGYTSYASLDDLPRRASVFADLKRKLDGHAAAFDKELGLDLGPRGRLVLDSLWVNVLKPGAAHSGHIHPSSVLSGTYYVCATADAGALRLEDPRLPLMMAAPPRADSFVTLQPRVGMVLMWESWLRHEVLPGKGDRVSLSFNYAWK